MSVWLEETALEPSQSQSGVETLKILWDSMLQSGREQHPSHMDSSENVLLQPLFWNWIPSSTSVLGSRFFSRTQILIHLEHQLFLRIVKLSYSVMVSPHKYSNGAIKKMASQIELMAKARNQKTFDPNKLAEIIYGRYVNAYPPFFCFLPTR